MTPSVASSVVKVAPRYCTQSITNGSVPLFRMERLPFGATLTTLPSATGNTLLSTWNSPLPLRKKYNSSWVLWVCRKPVSVPGANDWKEKSPPVAPTDAPPNTLPGILLVQVAQLAEIYGCNILSLDNSLCLFHCLWIFCFIKYYLHFDGAKVRWFFFPHKKVLLRELLTSR